MKTTVIYHSADFDGILCREIARKFLPDAEFIGWNFGDAKIPMPAEGTVYILDLSPECLSDNPAIEGFIWNRIIWIDHHKTSIEKWPNTIVGYRIDGVAACRLAWQWFSEQAIANATGEAMRLPELQHYVDRSVSEPLAVRLAGEFDIWDKRDERAETFQYGIYTVTPESSFWKALLSPETGDRATFEILQYGRSAQIYSRKLDASICKSRTWLMEWDGLKFLCVNSARFNSLLFAAKDVPETGHDALLGFCYDGKCWTVSLYHAKHRTDLDLSAIAKKYGGGGHAGACGYTCKTLPFAL
jgi:hypothetical protein